VNVKINRVEHRGGYKLVHADGPNGDVIAKVDSNSALDAGKTARLSFHPERTYIYRDSKLCGSVSVKGA